VRPIVVTDRPERAVSISLAHEIAAAVGDGLLDTAAMAQLASRYDTRPA